MLKYFKGSYLFTIIGLTIVWFWAGHTNPDARLNSIFVAIILSILEVSLSFDNAVINATKLEKMSKVWQHRFLTWGMLIAVFGMRFLFPLLIVAIFSKLQILEVINLAFNDSEKYSHYLHISHPYVVSFGGAFLIFLFFNYFLNSEKEIHWIKPIEKFIHNFAGFKSLSTVLTLSLVLVTQHFAPAEQKFGIVLSGIFGIITYLIIEGLSQMLEHQSALREKKAECLPKFNLTNSCFINFLYLELIDASFSLDGALGAFALSKDIIVITIGLSIGAMFVRSLTIMLVEKKTLKQYVYLEHGAHWAISALALIMFISTVQEVSEVITGLIGLVFIGASLISSVKENSKQ